MEIDAKDLALKQEEELAAELRKRVEHEGHSFEIVELRTSIEKSVPRAGCSLIR
jgi:hypothetical protein